MAAVAGILLGKYFTFCSIFKEPLDAELGAEATQAAWFISPFVIGSFVSSIAQLASPCNILSIILTLVAAWRIHRRLDFFVAEGT